MLLLLTCTSSETASLRKSTEPMVVSGSSVVGQGVSWPFQSHVRWPGAQGWATTEGTEREKEGGQLMREGTGGDSVVMMTRLVMMPLCGPHGSATASQSVVRGWQAAHLRGAGVRVTAPVPGLLALTARVVLACSQGTDGG